MQLQVNPQQRYAKMRAHTATHLLHTVLTTYFPNTKQAGSLVDSDLLRFDFYADTLLTAQQITEIETTINTYIYQSLPVELIETSLDEANTLGAKAFFEEKYEDQVRVIRILAGEAIISAEFCGGTHVENTKDIGAFAIISQEAVASGIKRLTAITGPKVIEKLHDLEGILDQQVSAFDIKSYTQITEKTTKFLKEYDEMKSKLESLEIQMIQDMLKSTERKSNIDFEVIIPIPQNVNFKVIGEKIKKLTIFSHDTKTHPKSGLLYNIDGNYIIITDGSVSAKELSQRYCLKGGGSDTVVQGRDITILDKIGARK